MKIISMTLSVGLIALGFIILFGFIEVSCTKIQKAETGGQELIRALNRLADVLEKAEHQN